MMNTNGSEDLLFSSPASDEKKSNLEENDLPPWVVLVVDDSIEIHEITSMVLMNFRFEGRKLNLLRAFSGEEAISKLKEHPDTALVILDVVMENEHAGLDVARAIREELHNHLVRIVLRTGQPGQAPEEEVVINYDINDYKDKSDLTSSGLKTMVISALRNYRDLSSLDHNRQGLLNIASFSSGLYQLDICQKFEAMILERLCAYWPLNKLISDPAAAPTCSGIWLQKKSDKLIASHGSGQYKDQTPNAVCDIVSEEELEFIHNTWKEKGRNIQNNMTALYIEKLDERFDFLIFLKGDSRIDADSQLIDIVCNDLTIASQNIRLFRDLNSLKNELEQIVENRTAEYLREKTKAEEASNAKSLFLANISHEIRTPLNAILGFTQLCLLSDKIPQENRVMLDSIGTAGKHLLEIINDVLELSKIEAGAMDLVKNDFLIRQLIDDIATMFEFRCEQKGIEWKLECNLPPTLSVSGDEPKIRQVLINLLGNAVKFTSSGSIQLTVKEDRDGTYIFEVKDTGPGIPQDQQELIFDSFHQVADYCDKGGTGLGLSISKKQVALMGGNLELDSTVGEGSTFYFRLTLSHASSEIKARETLGNKSYKLRGNQRVTALVVDDVVGNRLVLSNLLDQIGVDIIFATNGLEAVEVVKNSHVDIIFMDIRMPVMNGDEAVQIIKKDPANRDIRCVAISAYSMAHEIEYYLDSGFDRYISKPYQFEEIYKALEDLCDLELVSEEDVESTEEEFSPLDISDTELDPVIVRKLLDAAELNRMTEMRTILKEIDANDPKLHGLVTYVHELLNQYDSSGIIKLLESLSREN